MQRLEICSVCGLVLRRKKKEVRSSICFFFCFVLFCFVQFCTFWVVSFRMHALFNKMHIVPINNIYSKL